MYPAAFLEAIREDPADDTPRLIFADWLEDHDDPARAEMIRVQCELTRGVRDRGQTVELLRRLRELVRQHRTIWLGPLARRVPDAVFERGFVEHIFVDAKIFLKHGSSFLEVHPIWRLGLRDLSGQVDSLARNANFASIRWFECSERIDPDEVVTLFRSRHLAGIEWVDLSNTRLDSTGLPELVQKWSLRKLRSLILRYNQITDAAAVALTGSPSLAELERLDLSNNSLTDVTAHQLAQQANWPRLTFLRLAYNRLRRQGVEVLARSPALARLSVLDVTGNHLDRSTVASLQQTFGPRLVC